MFTETMTQALPVMGYLPTSNHATNTGDNSIAGIDMAIVRRLITFMDIGVVNTSANVQLYYRASASANMASPTNVASAVPVTSNTSNRVCTLEVRADQLPAGTRYVQPILVVNTSQVNVGLLCVGGESGYKPGSAYTLASTVDNAQVT